MSLWSVLMGEGIAAPVEAIGNAIDKTFTSDDERAQARNALAGLALKPGILAIELAKVEAAHRSVWVAGWRPAVGWVCAAGLAQEFIFKPWALALATAFDFTLVFPDLSPILMELTLGMVGIAGLRTVEKLAGRAK